MNNIVLIQDTKTYNPKKLDDTVLQDDWRTVNAWYATLKSGKKIEYPESVIISTGEKIMRELLKRNKVAFNPEEMKEDSKEFSIIVLKKIVNQKLMVEPPFGDLVYEDKVKGLVFCEDLPLTDVYLLTQGSKALGYIRFGPMPPKIDTPSSGAEFGTYHYKLTGDMFNSTSKVHKMTEQQRRERCGESKVSWLYPIRDFFPLEKPVQLALKIDTSLPKGFKAEDINPSYLKNLNDFSLVKIHGWLHNGFYLARKNKQAIERYVNAHAFLVDEMIERKMEHRPWSKLDEISKKYQVHKMSKPEDYLYDFLIRRPYAMAAGSVFVVGEGKDLDIIVRDFPNQYFKEAVLHYLKDSNIEDTDFVFSAWTSAFTNHIRLYNYGLTRNPRSEVYLQKIKLWNLNLQLPSFVNPEPKVYFKQDGNCLKFYIKEDATEERDGIIEFKLRQLLPLYYEREIYYSKYVPKDYKPVYWETWLREPEPEMITMSISKGHYNVAMAKGSKIKVMKYFSTMKPAKASKPGEPATLESFFAAFKDKDYPIYSQKKYDGVNTEIHRSGDKVKIWTEDGEDITHRVPNVVKEVKALNHNKFAITAEAEYWKGDFHYPREKAAGYFISKEAPDDSNIVFNVYDVVYTGPHGDITQKNEVDRLKVLDTFSFKQSTIGVPDTKIKLNKAPTLVAKNKEELRAKTKRLLEAKGSEGVVAKPFWGIYDTSGRRTEQVKYHKTVDYTARIVKRNTTKTPGVYVYVWAVKTGGVKPKLKHQISFPDGSYILGGKTGATSENFKKGDLIGIEAETINYQFDERDGTVRVSAWVPRVMKEPIHTIDTAKSMARRARDNDILTVKIRQDDGTEVWVPRGEFEFSCKTCSLIEQGFNLEDCDIESLRGVTRGLRSNPETTLQRYGRDIPIPSEVAKKERKWNSLTREQVKEYTPSKFPEGFFVIPHHFRGKGVHDDLRIKLNGSADGWTLSSAWPGKIKDSVDNLTEAAQVSAQDFVWKFSPDMPPTKHVFAERKPLHPLEWLTQVANVHEEGEVGATRFNEGVFYGYDWGLLYHGTGGKGSHGTSKPWFFEYFLRGKKFNCKLVFRLLEAPKEGKIKEGIFWQAWVAKNQYPYILTRAARLKRDWLPLAGKSALPPEVEALIPDNLKYWKMSLTKEAKYDMLDRVYNYLIDDGWIAARKLKTRESKKQELLSMRGKKVDFIFQDEWWKGPEVIRGQRQSRFYVKLKDGTNVQAISFKDKYPIVKVEDAGLAATVHKVKHGPLTGDSPTDWFKFQGQIPPGNPGHPKEIKKLPLHVEIKDRGDVQVIEDSETFKSFQFKGRLLRGYFILRRESPDSKLWVWEKSKLPAEGGPIK